MSTVEIVSRNICTGCEACRSTCPVSAINMVADSEGFRFPEVDHNLCIDCGKCFKICPAENGTANINNPEPKFYGVMADEQTRIRSASGGVFLVLADYILSKGGYVVGAVWDEYYKVKHVVTNDRAVVEKMSGSKYVQSEIQDCYIQTKKLLKDNIYVLFTGTPCQLAGLRAYLGKDYETLVCFDIACHGVPSYKTFSAFMKTIVLPTDPSIPVEDYDNYHKYVKSVQFRNKEYYGWSHSLIVDLSSGIQYSKSKRDTLWYYAYTGSNILNRHSCEGCKFNALPRVADISGGDFWGAGMVFPDLDTHNGISVVLINNEKGKKIFEELQDKFEFVKEVSAVEGVAKNGNLIHGTKHHPQRQRFFELLNSTGNFEKSYEFATKIQYDIGFIGWWYGINYGSVLTNFALNRYLVASNYSVLMIDYPVASYKDIPKSEESFSRRFANKHYSHISKHRTYGDLYQLNKHCDTFLVGSDQLWNYWSTKSNGLYFFLNFVGDYKKKVAYATSFGHAIYGAPPELARRAAYHLGRFDAVSVRENEGIDLCRDKFGVESVRNIDPVFICDYKEYDKLVEESARTEKDYILAYILTPTNEKVELLKKISEQTGKRICLILDAVKSNYEEGRRIMNMDESLVGDIEVEDWLYFVKNADFVITDSFHAVCFSLIFKKKFACIANVTRGLSRFTTILDIVNLRERMVLDPMGIIDNDLYNKDIDFDDVNRRLEPEIRRSQKWLDSALSENKPYKASTYDVLLQRITALEAKVRELENK